MTVFNTLQWRIVLAYTVLIVVSMAALSFYLVNFLSAYHDSNLRDRMAKQSEVLAESIRPYFTDQLDDSELWGITRRIGEIIGARVTVIAIDGTVLDDTGESPSTMDNHITRPEIEMAIANGVGHSTRLSQTLGMEFRYTAVSVEVDEMLVGIARIGIPAVDITNNVNSILGQIALAITIVTSISTLLGYYLARRTSRSVRLMTQAARRLASGDLDGKPVEALASDETQDLADAFNRMSDALRDMVGNLSEERNKLSAVLDTMTDGVVVIRRRFYLRRGEGMIELMNLAAQELLGIPVMGSVGSRFMEVIKDEQLQNLVYRASETNEQQYSEVELLQPRRYFGSVATPLLSSEGDEGVLLTLHDLTRVRQVDITRKQFVSNVSHELRSPITSIKAMAETLEGGALDEPSVAYEFVSRIHSEIWRMNNIVDELLQLSILDSGQVSLDIKPFDLNGLINEVKDEFATIAESNNVILTTVFEDLPEVNGEKEKIRQVLVNLIDNALKFTLPGGAITMSSKIMGSEILVGITDTGIGIEEDNQEQIFERFYRVDNSRKYEGTGLGLSIAKHIIQAHGGSLWVRSKKEEGSTFYFSLVI
jgi:two-component system phosphate regulon sensor histidine kinase PhoR